MSCITPHRHTLSAVALLAIFTSPQLLADDQSADISVGPQALSSALKEFSDQTGLQIAYVATLADNKSSPGTHGAATPAGALDDLLSGTDLEHQFVNEDTVAIGPAATLNINEDHEPGKSQPTSSPVLMAQNQTSAQQTQTRQPSVAASDGNSETKILDEIIVTGSLIRGTEASIGSKLQTIDRTDIESGGFGNIQEAIQSLPNVFKGGINEDTVSAENDGNFGGGTSINLRGLGVGSTLTLVNGRRLQEGGRSGGFVDISTIPTSMIERIEVLADGASATYGSDAIAGVVNVILRQDYSGAETSLRFGTITEGGSEEYRVSQLFGKSWDSGNVLFSYEYYSRDALGREDKPFSANADLRPLGGDDFRTDFSVPGNLLSPLTFQPAFAIPSGTNGILAPGDLIPVAAGSGPNLYNVNPERNLLLDQERHNVLLSASQEIGDRVELFAEGRYSNKAFETKSGGGAVTLVVPASNPFFVDPFGGSPVLFVRYHGLEEFLGVSEGSTEDYNSVLGAKIDLSGDWQLQVYGSYGRRDGESNSSGVDLVALRAALADPNPATAFNPFGDGDDNSQAVLAPLFRIAKFLQESDIRTLNAVADGTFFKLPGGDAKLAIGSEYYESTFESRVLDFGLESSYGRNVGAVFGEVLIPVIGKQNSVRGVQRLLISASARYEDYDDVGDTSNPKVGILWSPTASLDVRGTYGTSFRAPSLADLDELGPGNASILFSLPDPMSPTGSTLSMLLLGNNADLKNETATTWTAGFDYAPPSVPDLRFGVTYYNIEFEDRIAQAALSFAILAQEDRFGSVITRNPSQALIDTLCNDPKFQGADPATCVTLPIGAVVDFRLNNTAVTKTDGYDFDLSYSFETATVGHFDVNLGGTYIRSFEEKFSSTTPAFELVDTIGNPIGLRLRSSLGWRYSRGLSLTGFVNYADSYTDDISAPERQIDSWTTLDLIVAYETENHFRGIGLNDTRLSLNVRNVFNTDPPFVNNARVRVGYDPENASPLGRFISVNLTKAW